LARGRIPAGPDIWGPAIREHPDHYGAYLNLGTAYLRTNRPAEALALLDKALSLHSGIAKGHETRGLALWRMGRHGEALAAMEASFALDGRNADVLVWKGMLQCELRRFEEAVATFDRVVAMDESSAGGHTGRALALMELGALDRAAAALDRGAELAPDHPQVASARARLSQLRAAAENGEGGGE
jgi:tetratricopeptide (TPR) repeat protein